MRAPLGDGIVRVQIDALCLVRRPINFIEVTLDGDIFLLGLALLILFLSVHFKLFEEVHLLLCFRANPVHQAN